MNLGMGSLPARRPKVRPDDIAVVFKEHEWAYRQLDKRVTRVPNALTDAGVPKGHRAVQVGFNHPALKRSRMTQ
ncbi:hypothetical protein [Kocuria kalidii]|uniref:hypothetical protein n=1 Tax=Kocuria kalidii TaxID=3376283 RepID=UPI0037B5F15E